MTTAGKKSVSKKSGQSLVERMKNLKKQPRKIWLDSLTQDQREQLLELQVAFMAGEINVSAEEVYRTIHNEEFPLPVSPNTFRSWLTGK